MVPKEWINVSLGDVITYKKGFAFDSSNFQSHGVQIIRISDTTSNSISLKNPIYVSKEVAAKLTAFIVHEGDIVLSTVGSRPHLVDSMVGKAVRIPKETEGSLLNQNLVKLIPKKSVIINDYLYLMVKKSRFIYFISTLIRGNANQVSITLKELFKYKFPLPPLIEQKKITQILSTWDKAITTTEKLLVNSEQQKKALVQQLLTGKKRFPTDVSSWRDYALSEIFEFKKGKGLSKGVIACTGKKKCILYGELYTKYNEVIKAVFSRTHSNDGFPSKYGDVLVPCSTTTSGIDLAKATALFENDVLLGGDINVLRPKISVDSAFISYLLTHVKKNEIASRAQGITIIHLYGSDLKSLNVTIPASLSDQQKIASVFSTADQEIEKLKQKLDCLKQEKKALMQQLLTGKRRVKVAEISDD
ncbi:restriction endonuclease subunit S [Legionella pneumophila]|uniref:restriction endonuclease subunit S n=1 Tax=Legionella pneumophila TaxID=446 RepID=UPI0007707EAF|nr:restriction endonuclease subunit S [Legionella pneumophila]CZP19665.1 Putative type I restriction enzyme specificity protein MPN_638 [Legionella pneumophila]CZP47279.1 Putative type I restriction enzyme specificity protein MPN_638 [Legionella pneumophila]HAT4435256.1 restriction endonuclease subunit S [Legionella pneumophila]HAU0130317.1 restriction endonuclease subunit S [Legionella pneumophila]HBJ7683678.1 restriction endonuclease subunit S [Legionella pneumophila]